MISAATKNTLAADAACSATHSHGRTQGTVPKCGWWCEHVTIARARIPRALRRVVERQCFVSSACVSAVRSSARACWLPRPSTSRYATAKALALPLVTAVVLKIRLRMHVPLSGFHVARVHTCIPMPRCTNRAGAAHACKVSSADRGGWAQKQQRRLA